MVGNGGLHVKNFRGLGFLWHFGLLVFCDGVFGGEVPFGSEVCSGNIVFDGERVVGVCFLLVGALSSPIVLGFC